MTRYLIERLWDPMLEEELASMGPRSKQILSDDDRFASVVWEHSHTVMDEEGQIKSYCVYSSPDRDLILEHAKQLGGHSVHHIYEIGGDISPADFD